MNITIASKLMELYAACPQCGCEVIGNGKGLLEWIPPPASLSAPVAVAGTSRSQR